MANKTTLRQQLANWERLHGTTALSGVLSALALVRTCSLDPQLGECWRARAETILHDCQNAIFEQEEEDDG